MYLKNYLKKKETHKEKSVDNFFGLRNSKKLRKATKKNKKIASTDK
jgi:hypothetical protein